MCESFTNECYFNVELKEKKHCKNRVRSILLNVGSKKIVISQNRSNENVTVKKTFAGTDQTT